MDMTENNFDASSLKLARCPHCAIANPYLHVEHKLQTVDATKRNVRKWNIYFCSSCGGIIVGGCSNQDIYVKEIFPVAKTVDSDLPEKAASFLKQALECLHAPSGAIMLCASSVDAMLKEIDLKSGSLYSRIEAAAKQNLITQEMAAWAHDIRLDANDERHAEETVPLPTPEDAEKCIEFTEALGKFLFVLPKMVERGRAAAKAKQK